MMKTTVYTFLGLLIACITFNSCSDRLDVDPTTMASKEAIYNTPSGVNAAINGLYRFMNTIHTAGYEHENGGYPSVMLAHDVMADDMVMRDQGSAWFWYDHLYWVRGEIFSSSDRPNGWWSFYYKIIMQTNDVLANVNEKLQDEPLRNNVRAQAHALRAFAYYELINTFQLTYHGNESAPGVPIYTEPTDKHTEGKPRGKMSEVYQQINDDLDKAIQLFATSAQITNSKNNIDLYVAYGLKARTALMTHEWKTAKEMAEKALSKPNLALMPSNELGAGFNNLDNVEFMWGIKSNEEQNTNLASIFSHIDANQNVGYAKNAGKGISRWLYEKIPDTDLRKQWFNIPTMDWKAVTDEALTAGNVQTRQIHLKLYEDKQNSENTKNPDKGFRYHENSYLQKKLRTKVSGSWGNDVCYMRAAEMYLIAAEAACMLGDYATAKKHLSELVIARNPSYEVNTIPDGNSATVGSYAEDETYNNRSLLDEIYMQRRIELWGEGFRCYDLSRQKIAINRDFPETNFLGTLTKDKETGILKPNPGCALKLTYEENKWEIIMQIPDSEMTANKQINKEDQNP